MVGKLFRFIIYSRLIYSRFLSFFIEGNRDGARTIHAPFQPPYPTLPLLASLWSRSSAPSIFLLRLLAEFFSTFSLPVCKSFAREGRPWFSSSPSSFFFRLSNETHGFVVRSRSSRFCPRYTITSKKNVYVYIFGEVIDSFWIFIVEAFRSRDVTMIKEYRISLRLVLIRKLSFSFLFTVFI